MGRQDRHHSIPPQILQQTAAQSPGLTRHFQSSTSSSTATLCKSTWPSFRYLSLATWMSIPKRAYSLEQNTTLVSHAQLNLNLEVPATYTRSISWHQKQRGRSNAAKLSPLISPLLVALFRDSQSLRMVSHAPKNLALHLQLKSLRYNNS